MSKNLYEEGDSAPAQEQGGKYLSLDDLEKVAGGRPIRPLRPTANASKKPFEKTCIDYPESLPKY